MPEPIKSPRLPHPLTPQSLVGLMREPAYWDSKDPQFPTYQRLVKRGFEILYPGPVQHSDTGNMIDTPPLPPHLVASQVDAVNFGMESLDARAADRRENQGRPPAGALKDNMVHVESHTRDGGKTEVADYWRQPPGHSDGADKGAPENQNDPSQDTLHGQPGENSLPDSSAPQEPPKNAHVVPKKNLEDMVKEWPGQWHYPENEKEENKRQCTALVKAAIPEIGPASTWREGEKIIGPGNPSLEPGTAIATFENRRYPSRPTGNHAAIVLGPGVRDGKEGYWVLDQSSADPAKERFISFNDPNRIPTYRADRYSVIRRNK